MQTEIQAQPRVTEIARVEKRENQELFSESVRYAATSPEGTAATTQSARGARTYVTPEQASARINPSIRASNNFDFAPQNSRPNGEFDSDELRKLRGNKEERNYNESLDLRGSTKTRNKLPWEI